MGSSYSHLQAFYLQNTHTNQHNYSLSMFWNSNATGLQLTRCSCSQNLLTGMDLQELCLTFKPKTPPLLSVCVCM